MAGMTPEQQAAWMQQWRSAAVALAEERARCLRELTPEEALAASDRLLSLPVVGEAPVPRRPCGLIEQQAIFHRRR
jgi:hypothetical protein